MLDALVAEHEEGADHGHGRACGGERVDRRAHRGARADDVVDHGDAPAARAASELRGQAVGGLEQAGALEDGPGLGVVEGGPQRRRQPLREERAAHQRATDGGDVVAPEPLGQGGHAGGDVAGIGEQRVEGEPDVRVVAGLEQEVPRPRGHAGQEVSGQGRAPGRDPRPRAACRGRAEGRLTPEPRTR